MKLMCWPSHPNPWVLFQSPNWLGLLFPQSVFILDPFVLFFFKKEVFKLVNLLVASILLHSTIQSGVQKKHK